MPPKKETQRRCNAIAAAARCPWWYPRPGWALVLLLGGDAQRFGMGPAVMPGQDLADVAWPVGEGTATDLTAGDRQMGDGHREAAGT